jgi:hypothetical protein
MTLARGSRDLGLRLCCSALILATGDLPMSNLRSRAAAAAFGLLMTAAFALSQTAPANADNSRHWSKDQMKMAEDRWDEMKHHFKKTNKKKWKFCSNLADDRDLEKPASWQFIHACMMHP